MRVLLRSDVSGIGRRGDIVTVADGYARNFLLPTGAAFPATDSMAGQASAMRRARDLKNAQSEEAARTVAEVLDHATITIAARAGSSGRLFGSVTAHDIAAAIKEQSGVTVDDGAVGLAEPLKNVGVHAVTIRLFGEISAEIQVEVTPAG